MEEQIEHDSRAIEMYKSKVFYQCLTIGSSCIQSDNIKSIQFVDQLPLNKLQVTCLANIRFDRVPTKLTKLHFASCAQASYTGLEQMRQLTYLSINSNMPPLKHINFISTLVNLTNLDLSQNQIKDLRPLQNLIGLKEINLSHNDIEDISPLRKLIKTEILQLGYNKIVDVNPLKYLIELKELHIQNNLLFTVKPLQILQKLTFCENKQNVIQDKSVQPIVSALDENEELEFFRLFNYYYKDLLEQYEQLTPTKQQQLFSDKIRTVYEQQEQLQQEENLIRTAKLHITQMKAQTQQILAFAQQSNVHWTHNIVQLFQTLICNYDGYQ
ncbi:ABC_transporter substrate-binding protein [Hexamita inflata]|uniref:ABC transporter substrate-binding protein n=1 Tax=Hexamita inflata TaxID=28002 RepID=A0AA86V076_9EUKA|nr:ABC transporter substrate-binding protein [Hexamita inflata]